MKNHHDLPTFLYTEDGKKVAIRGYLLSAQMEARDGERQVFANYLLKTAADRVIEMCGEQHLRDWCELYLRTNR